MIHYNKLRTLPNDAVDFLELSPEGAIHAEPVCRIFVTEQNSHFVAMKKATAGA